MSSCVPDKKVVHLFFSFFLFLKKIPVPVDILIALGLTFNVIDRCSFYGGVLITFNTAQSSIMSIYFVTFY